jgi:cupin 2 domain-containing protein
MISDSGNLFADIPPNLAEELLQILWQTPHLKMERIVSRGQATPEGQWYDQDTDEWVVLLKGAARLRMDGRDATMEMKPGDYVLLPAKLRHRVEWTAADEDTVWLAIHCPAASG